MYNDIDYSGSEVVELTQADYDARPSSKYSDDVTYLIKDVYSPSSTKNMGLGDCYSTSEKVVGCWIDGKPLYQRTVVFGSISAGGYKVIDLTSANVQSIAKLNGIGILNDCTLPIPTSHTTTMGNQMFCRWNNDQTLGVYVGNLDGLVDCYVTIQYTKTTDVAGSGNWTPEGVPAVHYSTGEHIVGTWINGKTIYERTILLSQFAITLNDSQWQNLMAIDADYLVSAEISAQSPNTTHIVRFWIDSGYLKGASSSQIYLPNFASSQVYATIRYTKSS